MNIYVNYTSEFPLFLLLNRFVFGARKPGASVIYICPSYDDPSRFTDMFKKYDIYYSGKRPSDFLCYTYIREFTT